MKAMLVIDMPQTCTACPITSICATDGRKAIAIIRGGGTEGRMDWCPLKPMPKWTVNRNCVFSEKGGVIPDEWVYDFLTEIMGETDESTDSD